MNLPKQIINLLGAVLAVAILIAGGALIALPMYGGAQATEAGTRTVAQTNDIYDIQVSQLAAEAESIDETTADVAALRAEIAKIPQLDDVYELVITAAQDTAAVIVRVSAADAETWIPRSGLDPAGQAVEVEPAAEPDAEAEIPAGDSAEPPADPASESAVDTAESPQRQVPVTIEVAIADAAAAAEFIDALGMGPRLLLPIDGTFADGTLTVTALAFIQTED